MQLPYRVELPSNLGMCMKIDVDRSDISHPGPRVSHVRLLSKGMIHFTPTAVGLRISWVAADMLGSDVHT